MDIITDRYRILQGDCLARLSDLPAKSVQTCPTSPPYFGLRDYGLPPTDWPAMEYSPMPGMPPVHVSAMTCCLGMEPDPGVFLGHMVAVFREVHRSLRDDGTVWLNLGDSYCSRPNGSIGATNLEGSTHTHSEYRRSHARRSTKVHEGLKHKDLIGIPWRVAFALQADGWYLRQDIIWSKPNPMPESVNDRCTKAHEYIFLLSKGPRYYYDHEAVKEPAVCDRMRGPAEHLDKKSTNGNGGLGRRQPQPFRNRRSVWTVSTKPYKGAHFATFPPDLIEPCILAGTSEKGHCPECGALWERVTEKETRMMGNSAKAGRTADDLKSSGKWRNGGDKGNKNLKSGPCVSTTTVGWQPACECGHDPIPDMVLDPFNGSGTTGAVALQHGRHYVGLELNPEYIDLAVERIETAIAPAKPKKAKPSAPTNERQFDLLAGAPC